MLGRRSYATHGKSCKAGRPGVRARAKSQALLERQIFKFTENCTKILQTYTYNY